MPRSNSTIPVHHSIPNPVLQQPLVMTTQYPGTTQITQDSTSTQHITTVPQKQPLMNPPHVYHVPITTQHPCTTHVSHVSSVSKQQTPYAFSDSEDDSHSDGDQLLWQVVAFKGKKRAKSFNTGTKTLKNTRQQTYDCNPSFVSSNNNNLPQENSSNTKQIYKEPPPPSIFVLGIINMQL